jgi:four helix bundle protein
MSRNFNDLKIFVLSYDFLLEIYAVLPSFPESELRNMYSQLQRASTSIVLNIVEGASNRSNKVFFNHLQYSFGSCKEVMVLLRLAKDLSYINEDLFLRLHSLVDELSASIYRFMQSVDKEIKLFRQNYSF